jgi:LytR cell envelope-related transcriptional attenuator
MEAIIALSTSGFIEKYGAYAGLAAIPGLAVLSLLYFAQAREVRRLRDWAGRAPERDVERSTSGVHVAPTGARDPVSVVRRSPPPGATRPAGRPATPGAAAAAPASPAAAPPKPAGGAAVPAAATAAAAAGAAAVGAGAAERNDKPPEGQPAAKPGEDSPEAKPADVPAPSPAAAPQQNGPGDPSHVEAPAQRPAAAPAQRSAAPAAATAAGAAGARASAGPAAPPRPVPREQPSEPQPAAQPGRPSSPGAAASRAAPLQADRPRAGAPGRGGRDPVPPRRDGAGGRPRRAAYIAVAAVLLIVLVVVIVAATSGGSSQPKTPNTIAPNQQPAQNGATPKRRKAAPVQRGDVKVAALNGTTQAGLAAQLEKQITASGFAKGQVTNAADQQAQKTIVYYASGQKKAAQEVASIIKAGAVQPIDPDTRAIAGNDAEVVVLVGADKT